MKRELSKDEKIQLGGKIFVGILAVSIVSGTFGYMKYEHDKAQKQVAYEIENGLNGAEYLEETTNKVLESLLAKPLSDNVLAEIDKSVIEETTKELENTFEKENTTTLLVENSVSSEPIKLANTESTGYDKNGHPYLLKGKDYTFNADGTPVEAPPSGQKSATIVNPNTGVKYTYGYVSKQWNINRNAEIDARASKIANGEMMADGTILTDENRAYDVSSRIKLNP